MLNKALLPSTVQDESTHPINISLNYMYIHIKYLLSKDAVHFSLHSSVQCMIHICFKV